MKLLVGLNKKDFSLYLNYTNSFIIGLKDFSINYTEFSLKEIKEIREKYPNCEIFHYKYLTKIIGFCDFTDAAFFLYVLSYNIIIMLYYNFIF